ncbi:Hypothetical predicted protein, partial [Pelobates cultripes]
QDAATAKRSICFQLGMPPKKTLTYHAARVALSPHFSYHHVAKPTMLMTRSYIIT